MSNIYYRYNFIICINCTLNVIDFCYWGPSCIWQCNYGEEQHEETIRNALSNYVRMHQWFEYLHAYCTFCAYSGLARNQLIWKDYTWAVCQVVAGRWPIASRGTLFLARPQNFQTNPIGSDGWTCTATHPPPNRCYYSPGVIIA